MPNGTYGGVRGGSNFPLLDCLPAIADISERGDLGMAREMAKHPTEEAF